MPAPASLISSPYNSEARYSKKRETTWVGYKVHLTRDLRSGNTAFNHEYRNDLGDSS